LLRGPVDQGAARPPARQRFHDRVPGPAGPVHPSPPQAALVANDRRRPRDHPAPTAHLAGEGTRAARNAARRVPARTTHTYPTTIAIPSDAASSVGSFVV